MNPPKEGDIWKRRSDGEWCRVEVVSDHRRFNPRSGPAVWIGYTEASGKPQGIDWDGWNRTMEPPE